MEVVAPVDVAPVESMEVVVPVVVAPVEATEVVVPVVEETVAPAVVDAVAETVVVPPVVVVVVAAEATEVVVPEAVVAVVADKRVAEDVPEGAAAPPAKKARITQATVKKFLRKGKLLEHQIFTWRDWENIVDGEAGDVTFYGCRMKKELKNADGEVILKLKQSIRRVEWYTSKSIVVFYPTGSVAASIICPLSIVPGFPLI